MIGTVPWLNWSVSPPVNLYPDTALWLSRLLQMEIQASRPGLTNTQLISENKSVLLQLTVDMVTSTKSIHQFLHPLFCLPSTREEKGMRHLPPHSPVKAVDLLTDTDQ